MMVPRGNITYNGDGIQHVPLIAMMQSPYCSPVCTAVSAIFVTKNESWNTFPFRVSGPNMVRAAIKAMVTAHCTHSNSDGVVHNYTMVTQHNTPIAHSPYTHRL